MAGSDAQARSRDWQEVLVTVLLVVAALGTSWSSYQATRWNGEQAEASGRTNGIRIEAARAQGRAQSETQVDVATFIAWVDAERSGERDLADFYVDRGWSGRSSALHQEKHQNVDVQRTPTITLDRLCKDADASRLVFKIDVEGYEPQVLRGMTRLLDAPRLWGIIELNAEFLRRQNSSAPAFVAELARRFDVALLVHTGALARGEAMAQALEDPRLVCDLVISSRGGA